MAQRIGRDPGVAKFVEFVVADFFFVVFLFWFADCFFTLGKNADVEVLFFPFYVGWCFFFALKMMFDP